MKTLKDKLLGYSKIFLRISVFALAALALYLILPSEPRFKFEYQKGAPWKHENLVAPFDFAILKSTAEIDAERKEVMAGFAPYFFEDTTIVLQKINELVTDLANISEDDYPSKTDLLNALVPGLRSLYTMGILASSPESLEILKDKSEVSVVKGNTVFKTEIINLLSEKSAYNLFRDQVNEARRRFPELSQYIASLDPGKYIRSNMRYDENYSSTEKQRLENSISTARGMVQSGERIILEGEIVDDLKFQLLESLKWAYEKKTGRRYQQPACIHWKTHPHSGISGLAFQLFIYL
jgi:cyclic-di-AMP phosphodiesterase PgpH